jgi:hypothetical protein
MELRFTNLLMTLVEILFSPRVKLFTDPDAVHGLLLPVCKITHKIASIHHIIKKLLITFKEIPGHVLVNTLFDSIFGL